MFAAISIAECNAPVSQEDAEVFSLVHRRTRSKLDDKALIISGSTVYLVEKASEKEVSGR